MKTTYTDYTLYRAQQGGRSAINAVVAVQEAIDGESVLIYSATEAYSKDMRNRILRGLWGLQLGFWDSNGTLELEGGGSIRFETPKASVRGLPAVNYRD